jgi:hypothetical protein
MKKRNSLKERFLSSRSDFLIDDAKGRFRENIRFSFEYFDNSQAPGQDFRDWEQEHLYKLMDKLKEYCKNPLRHWMTMKIGGGKNHVLEIYKKFPHKSEFIHPKSVPLDVDWARFRLEGDMRLVGFVVPSESCDRLCLLKDTFYVVFLDANHKFYIT